MAQLKTKKVISVLNKTRYNTTLLNLGEILYWLILIFLSLFFIQIHGPLKVSDGYFEYAQSLKAMIFNDSENYVNPQIPYITRIMYPLLVAMISGFLNIGLFEIGVIISLVSGIGSVFFMSKLAMLLNDDQKTIRFYRMAYGSFGGFVIYWTKFSTDMLFCFFTIASIFYVFMIWKRGFTSNNIFWYCLWTLMAILTRELGIFLIYPLFFILAKRKSREFQIIMSGIITILTILIGILYFLIFFDQLLQSYQWLEYLYSKVLLLSASTSNIQYKNLSTAVNLFLDFYLSPATLFTILFAVIFTFGTTILLLLLIYTLDFKFNLLHKKGLLKLNKEILLWLPFILPYMVALYVLQARYMNERYLLPITSFGILLLGIYCHQKRNQWINTNEKILKKVSLQLIFFILIIINIIPLILRLFIILI